MVLNLAAYHFVALDDPDALAARLHQRCLEAGLRGSALIAPEGINLFLAGADGPLRAVVDWLRGDPCLGLADMAVKWSHSASVPFRRLRVKRKREIISFRKDGLDPAQQRAPVVDPLTLRRWLEQGCDDAGREVVLLDTRNTQETAYGTFEQALTLPITRFTELPQALEAHRSALADKTVVSFCTGGIRCEKATLWMREAGYASVVQLDGGILGYFEQVGGYGYRDRCFVFDERVALDPGLLPLCDTPLQSEG